MIAPIEVGSLNYCRLEQSKSFSDVRVASLCQYSEKIQAQCCSEVRDVLFVHGWASSLRIWRRTQEAVSQAGFVTWAVDLPGFGDSPALDGAFSISAMTHALADFIEQAGLQRPAIVAHSMGGTVALNLAITCPDLVGRLMLVNPVVTGRLGFSLNIFLRRPLGQWLLGLGRHFWPLATVGALSMCLSPRHLFSGVVKRTREELSCTAAEAAIGSLRSVLATDLTERLCSVRAPTLIVVGERDLSVPPNEGVLAAQKIPQARLLRLNGVSHVPMDGCPLQFVRLVLCFLRNSKNMDSPLMIGLRVIQ